MYSKDRFVLASLRPAFTLVEVMVVLVILALLAGVVTLNVRGYTTKGYQSTAKMEIRAVVDAIESYQAVTGHFPTNEQGLAVLSQKSDDFPEPLLAREPIDPWGRPYEYVRPGRNTPYEVMSFGADGRPGGEGVDADISSTQLRNEKSHGE